MFSIQSVDFNILLCYKGSEVYTFLFLLRTQFMSQNPKIYWARPITSYSRTHFDILNAFSNGEKTLCDEQLKIHSALAVHCAAVEQKVYSHLKQAGYDIVDPGSNEVAISFEAWRNQSEKNKANPMPFFTDLTKSCDDIVFTCFDDDLSSPDVVNAPHRVGCGVWKEVDTVASREQPGKILSIDVRFNNPLTDGSFVSGNSITTIYLQWPKNRDVEKDIAIDGPFLSGPYARRYTCLDYAQTKALLVLQGYESRSSKHKEKQAV